MNELITAILPFARFVGIVFPTLYAGVTCQCKTYMCKQRQLTATNTGFTASDSVTFVQPIVDHAPNAKIMAKQWLRGYQYGPLWVPPLVMPGTLSNVFLAAFSPDTEQRRMYILAAVGIFCILPITFLYMEPGINGASKWKAQQILGDEWIQMEETTIFRPSAHKHGSTQASRRWAEKTDMKSLILFWRRVNNIRWVVGGLAAMASGYATFSRL
jgi:hypothetical protein